MNPSPVGVEAVRIARSAIESGLGPDPPTDPALPFRSRPLDPEFDELRGVFVTLSRYPEEQLRGCIGYPEPVFRLREALPRAAVAAAVEDPRFPPVRYLELGRITVEVSLLTPPREVPRVDPDGRRAAVDVGRHGLIVRRGRRAGLLLPQVAPEQQWSAEEFLRGTCEKAGLPEDAWEDPGTTVETFEAHVYGEKAPGGPIVLRPLIPPVEDGHPR